MATLNYTNPGGTTAPVGRTPYVKPPTLWKPGMTQQQFEQALATDPGYQAILHDPANQGPHGLTPQAWLKAQQYAGDAGLNDLNAQSRDDVAGAFRSGGSRYTVDGNGGVAESHDSWANPETMGALLGIGMGATVAAPYVAPMLGSSGTTAGALGPSTAGNIAATGAVASSAPAGIAASTIPAAATGGFASSAGHFLASQGGASAISTAGSIFSNIYGASKQADANKYAADLADAATRRAEQFSREQAEGAYQSNEHTQHANYDQWRAKEDAIMGSLGHHLGINYTAPDYSPGIDPRYTGGAAVPTGPASATTPNGPDPSMAAFIRDYQASHPVSEGIAPLTAALKAKGYNVDRFMYGTTPSDNELNVNGQKYKVLGGENSPAAYWYQPGMNDGGAAPVARPTLSTFASPNFMPLPTPYRPGTLGAYVGS